MKINLSKEILIEDTIYTEFDVISYGIHYDNNLVCAVGGIIGSRIFSCTIIDDLDGADLSIDSLNATFKEYVENNYPEYNK